MFTGTIDLVGDINLRRCLESDEKGLDDVAQELAAADVRLGNLEGAFADDEAELFYKPGWYHGQPEMAQALVGRFDAVGCANNVHYGEAILPSLAVLDEHGIAHTGAGADLEAAHVPAVVGTARGSVGMLAYTSVFEPSGHAAGSARAGVATIKGLTSYEPNPRVLHMPGAPALVHTWADAGELSRAASDVRSLREQVDFLVVYMHFGVSMSPTVHDYQREIAHALIDAGANVVAGSHSHTLGAIEFYEAGMVFYSLGNFVFNVGFHPGATRDGALVTLDVHDSVIQSCTLLATFRDERARTAFVSPDSGDGARIAEMIRTRCAEFGTKVTASGSSLSVTR